jgi:hypothetical protein
MSTRLVGLRLACGVKSGSERASPSARSAFGIRAGDGAPTGRSVSSFVPSNGPNTTTRAFQGSMSALLMRLLLNTWQKQNAATCQFQTVVQKMPTPMKRNPKRLAAADMRT